MYGWIWPLTSTLDRARGTYCTHGWESCISPFCTSLWPSSHKRGVQEKPLVPRVIPGRDSQMELYTSLLVLAMWGKARHDKRILVLQNPVHSVLSLDARTNFSIKKLSSWVACYKSILGGGGGSWHWCHITEWVKSQKRDDFWKDSD